MPAAAKATGKMPPELKNAIDRIGSMGYEVRCIAAGFDGIKKWAVHEPDPTTGTGYNPRSYLTSDALMAVAALESRQDIRAAIVAAQHKNPSKYITVNTPRFSKAEASFER